MDEKTKSKLTELATSYFDLNASIKELRGKSTAIKSEIEEVVIGLGISDLDVEGIKFALSSKSLKRFKKSEFASKVGVDKSDVNEKLIAELVENKKTNSKVIGDYIDTKASRNLKIKKIKAKNSKKK